MKTLEIGTTVKIKKTLTCKFFKGAVCILDSIQNYGGVTIYRLKHSEADSYSWYSRTDFTIVN
jgi:hypothetical protein